VRVWSYQARPECIAQFAAAYANDGAWALLFSGGAGYRGTCLYRDTADSTRFVTLDEWDSQADWQAFLSKCGDDYGALDAALEHMTAWERCLFEGSAD
jgi:heme-degrading monooxygenase HmoA